MDKLWTIYEHISPSGKVYIGITSQDKVCKRWQYGNGYVCCTIFYKAIKKYGWKNFQHNIIASNLGEMTAKNMEKDLIKYYKEKGISYNITDGGDGTLGRKFSEDTIRKMSKSHKGKIITESWRNNMRIGQLNRDKSTQYIPTIEDRVKQSLSMKAYYKNHSSPRKGVTLTDDIKYKCMINQKTRKSVTQYTLDMKVVKEYPSISNAAKANGFSISKIAECCKKDRGKYKNYYWRYSYGK